MSARDMTREDRQDWHRTRGTSIQRDGLQCQVCKRQIANGKWEAGHIVDRCARGSDDPSNVVVMCEKCNHLKPVHETREEYDAWVDSGFWFGAVARRYYKSQSEFTAEEILEEMARMFGFDAPPISSL